MLGAIVSLLLVVAAAYAVTQVGGVITLLFIAAVLFLAYRRLSLLAFTTTFTVLLAAYTVLGAGGAPAGIWKGFLWLLLAGLWLLNVRPLRKQLITRPFMKTYLKLLPTMSQTEKEALDAGTVWWDGELFTGAPRWSKLLSAKAPKLSAAEAAFLDGPCEELCRMLDDWSITHERADLPAAVWEFLKTRGFFAMIIPKKYGGLEFSAYAHSCVLAKISSRSATTSSTVAVPNSLGPAELLNHYGTEEQKSYYLPRLARGEEVPCFALTGPRAGSDASSIPDTGMVCRGTWQGREIIGLKLNFSKRYITLAPVATVIGLAFRMFDPEKLLGGKTDIGITCALIPRNTPGVTIGRRHFPLNVPFQNGPIQGRDVFVPLDFIIGGSKMAGSGWRMLVEQLSVGRCISLPSNATGAAKAAVWATGAYARIRSQFNTPVGRFEGVEAVIARMAGLTYIMDAARSVTAGAIDGGEKPSVPSAMLKYHVTEMGRALFAHIGFSISNAVRSFIMALTHARFTRAPVEGPTARYYQHIVRFSASFAFAVDVAMLALGGYLKKKESLSARLGDVLSCMYLASMVLKHHENQGRLEEDLPIVEWACRSLLYHAQEQLHGFLRNFGNRLLALAMRALIFPRGRVYSAPPDRLGHKLAGLVINPTEARERLSQYIYWTLEPTNPLGLLQEALLLAVQLEPLEKRIRVEGVKTGKVTALDLPGRIQQALAAGIVSETEAAALRDYDRKVMELIHVDDFEPQELAAHTVPASQSAARSSAHVA